MHFLNLIFSVEDFEEILELQVLVIIIFVMFGFSRCVESYHQGSLVAHCYFHRFLRREFQRCSDVAKLWC